MLNIVAELFRPLSPYNQQAEASTSIMSVVNKGVRIRFTRGNHCGKTGWLNADKVHTKCYWYVIVKIDEEHEELTKARKTSVKEIGTEPPPTYEHAVLQQHPDIETLIEALAVELAKCDVSGTSQVIQHIVITKLQEARNAQDMAGNSATWRHVDWAHDDAEV
jgi:hypothetical protein